MISFLPCEKPDCIEFTAFENEKEVGKCTFYVEKYTMYFTAFSCIGDIMAEGLARSAMNCAANKGAYIAKISSELSNPAFIRLGFEGENELTVEIPQALSSCCSCGDK